MIVVITGPTAVGKTTFSIKLAKILNAEIINADSVQVYQELNIGSDKITEEEKEGVIHHLLDFVSPEDDYTVYDYQKDARLILDRLIKENKNIVIVGGTGLYIKALLYDYKFKEEALKEDFSHLSDEELLRKINQLGGSREDPKNRQRLERELNRKLNNSNKEENSQKLYEFKGIGLTKDRKELYAKINKRVDTLIESGLIDEVSKLYSKYPNSRVLNSAIGYKEVVLYLKDEISLEEAKELIKKNTRNYAKRQETFFKHQMNLKYFDLSKDSFEDLLKYLGGS